MGQNIYKKLKTQWTTVKSYVEIADVAFIFLRAIILCGGVAWLIFSDISQKTFGDVSSLFFYFIAYSVLIYLWLFLSPEKKRTIYGFSLFFDLFFASLLVRVSGGFDSSFSNGFYLITALYSFYYGLIAGAVIATIAAVLYFLSGGFDFSELYWTDFSVRIAFLFLLALPLGMLSQKMKRDKDKIETLNKDLKGYIEELRNIQGKLIEVEKLSAIGRLTADVAHEIRNPLTSIGGFARRLEKKLAQDTNLTKEKEYAEIVTSEVDRLERILRDVLTFSREAKFNMEYQEINNAIKESLQTFIEMCNEQSIQIEEKLDASLPLILIDRDQIRLAVNNLISNAIDAMSKGDKLTVKTFMEKLYDVNFVVVEVTDTGRGIPKEKLDKIFEPFYTTKEIGKGTGLGLSLCKKIIDEHNGLITVESKLGKGTSFKLFLPYQSKEDEGKIKCWEFHKCGVERAEGAVEMRCPAYPHYGRICWVVAGTFCGKRVSGAIAQKLGDCRKCEFYQKVVLRKDI
jgi:signal transduction histidine kinase